MSNVFHQIHEGDSPIIGVAIHAGHDVRSGLMDIVALSDSERLREEDPFTGDWATIASSHVIASRSRFEVDLNRPRARAVYQRPEDAWGLRVWGKDLPTDFLDASLSEYDRFYAAMYKLLSRVKKRHGHFVVLDFHSYNHRRSGPDSEPQDPRLNPDVNLGTGTMDRDYWAPVVDQWLLLLRVAEWIEKAYPDVILNIRDLHSSESGFAVPDRCAAWLDLHIPCQNSMEHLSEGLKALIQDSLSGSTVTHYEIGFPTLAQGYELTQEGLLPELLRDAYSQLKLPWSPGSFRSHSDANLLWNVQCKPVILGPGQLAKAHTRDESIALEDVELGADIYLQILRRLHNLDL